jgi:hypothetical protein
MISSRDYWRVMNGGYLDNPHFSFIARTIHEIYWPERQLSVVRGPW